VARPPSGRTQVRRAPDRGAYDRATIDAILDEGLVCHLGFVVDGSPRVIPTGYARDGDRVLLHGSRTSASMRALAAGAEACVTVTLLDGLVLARSAFHHSMNYRSVVVLGAAVEVADPVAKAEALRVLTDHLVPGRSADARAASPRELELTTVVALPLDEASAKVRTGGPLDEADDHGLPVWAGVIPLDLRPSAPVDDATVAPGAPAPAYVTRYRRP
jgi:nitroimidazol reductase NimA-like FMN-containing flavoprotein (pyridoxamine 5'-phosphate oxidase superfamily)